MQGNGLVVDREAPSFLSAECERIIDTRKRLPDFVFRGPFADYFAIEYGHIYKKSFGMLLFQIATIFEDESVNYMALDPPPDSYYRASSVFGAASFQASSLVERYESVLSREQNVPQLLAGVNVGVFWGSSLKWGIHCDRISWEMAVIAVSEHVDVPRISGYHCMDASWLADYVKSLYHAKDPSDSIASDFTRGFLANYPI